MVSLPGWWRRLMFWRCRWVLYWRRLFRLLLLPRLLLCRLLLGWLLPGCRWWVGGCCRGWAVVGPGWAHSLGIRLGGRCWGLRVGRVVRFVG